MSDLTAILRQIHGMAIKGCDAPTAADRWCERINEVMHLGAPVEEYEPWGADLPLKMQKLADAKGTIVNATADAAKRHDAEVRADERRKALEEAAALADEEGWPAAPKRFVMTEREEGSRDCADRIAAAIRAMISEPSK